MTCALEDVARSPRWRLTARWSCWPFPRTRSMRHLKRRARGMGRYSSTPPTILEGNGRRWLPTLPELAAGARVVKAFNASFAPAFETAAQLERPANLVFCGDDDDAKQIVSGLIRDIGFEPVDVGGLDQAANLEAFARMNVNLAYGQGRGPFVYRFDNP